MTRVDRPAVGTASDRSSVLVRARSPRVPCPDGAEHLEGTTFDIGLYPPIRALPGQVSADGVPYTGTAAPDLATTVTWSFTATP